MPNRTNRTPTDGTSNTDRRKDRLPDPEESGQFDPAIATDVWTCAANVFEDGPDPKHYVCDRHDQHDPDPAVDGHYWRAVDHPTDEFGMVADGVYVPARDGDSLVAP